MRKQENQILCPAFAKLLEATIHSRAYHTLAQAEENRPARPLDETRKGDVFQQAARDRGMASRGVICASFDENVLPVRGCSRCVRIADAEANASALASAHDDARDPDCHPPRRFLAAGQMPPA